MPSEKTIKVFNKGLNTDSEPSFQPEGTYRFMLNGVINGVATEDGAISNIMGNVECVNIPNVNYSVLGSHLLPKGETLLFIRDEDNNCDIIAKTTDNCTFEILLRTKCLNFSLSNPPVSCHSKLQDGCDTIIYFTDTVNPYYSININKLYLYLNNDVLGNSVSAANANYANSPNPWNCNAFRHFSFSKLPEIRLKTVNNNLGNLPVGSVATAIRYYDSANNFTEWLVISNVATLIVDNQNLSYFDIHGAYPSNPVVTGDPNIAKNSRKSITYSLSNVDTTFEFYQLALIKYSQGLGIEDAIPVFEKKPIKTTDFDVIVTGNETVVENIVRGALNEKFYKPHTVKHHTQALDRLVIANYTEKKRNWAKYVRSSCKIVSNWITDANSLSDKTNPNTAYYSFDKKSEMRDEIQSYGIIYLFSNGTESPPFHIPGRPEDNGAYINTQTNTIHDLRTINGLNLITDNTIPYYTWFCSQNQGKGWLTNGYSYGNLAFSANPLGAGAIYNDFNQNVSLIPNKWDKALIDTFLGNPGSAYDISYLNPDEISGTSVELYKLANTALTLRWQLDETEDSDFINAANKVTTYLDTPDNVDGSFDNTGRDIDYFYPKQGLMGYHENYTETYPDTRDCDGNFIYDSDYWGYSLFNQPVRHHRLPSIDVSPFYTDLQLPDKKYRNGNVAKNDFMQQDVRLFPLGVIFGNIDTDLDDDIVGYYIVRTDKNDNNKTILDKGLCYNSTVYAPTSGTSSDLQSAEHSYISDNYPFATKNLRKVGSTIYAANFVDNFNATGSYAPIYDNTYKHNPQIGDFTTGSVIVKNNYTCFISPNIYLNNTSVSGSYIKINSYKHFNGYQNSKYDSTNLNNGGAVGWFTDKGCYTSNMFVVKHLYYTGVASGYEYLDIQPYSSRCGMPSDNYKGIISSYLSSGILDSYKINANTTLTVPNSESTIGTSFLNMQSQIHDMCFLKVKESNPVHIYPTMGDYNVGCGLDGNSIDTSSTLIQDSSGYTNGIFDIPEVCSYVSIISGIKDVDALNSNTYLRASYKQTTSITEPIFSGYTYLSYFSLKKTSYNGGGILPGVGSGLKPLTMHFVIGAWYESTINAGLRDSRNPESIASYFAANQYRTFDQLANFMYLDAGDVTNNTFHSFTNGVPGNERGKYYYERFSYNPDFSVKNNIRTYFPLGANYDYCANCDGEFKNTVIYSEKSFSGESSDSYKYIKTNNGKTFFKDEGEITNVIVDKDTLLVHFENTIVGQPLNNQQIKTEEGNLYIGNGEFLIQQAVKLFESSHAYGGSIDKFATEITENNIFYVDRKSRKIFAKQSNGIVEISRKGMQNYFNYNIPLFMSEYFKKTYGIDFPILNTIHPNGVGYKSAYDPVNKKLILHKKDYALNPNLEITFTLGRPLLEIATIDNGIIAPNANSEFYYFDTNYGWGYLETGNMTDDGDGISRIEILTDTIYNVSDSILFENKSWTLTYDIEAQCWESFWSYQPNWIWNDNNTFYTTLNRLKTEVPNPYLLNPKFATYKHNDGQYQMYYGKLYPYVFEYIDNKGSNTEKYYNSLQWITKAQRLDSDSREEYEINDITFNALTVYNRNQVSLNHHLVPRYSNYTTYHNYYDSYFINDYVTGRPIENINIDVVKVDDWWKVKTLRDYAVQRSWDLTTPVSQTSFFTSGFYAGLGDYQNWFNMQTVSGSNLYYGQGYIDKTLNMTAVDASKSIYQQSRFKDKWLAVRLGFYPNNWIGVSYPAHVYQDGTIKLSTLFVGADVNKSTRL